MPPFIKIIFISFVLLIFSQPTFSQTERQLTQTTLPLQFVVGDPPPYLEPTTTITIEGKSFPIIFDTGAKKVGLILSEAALRQLTVKFTGQKICFKMVHGQYCEKEFIVPKLMLGSFILENVHGAVLPNYWNDLGLDRNKASIALANGMMGFPLLAQFNFLVDPQRSQLVLVKPHHQPKGYDIQNWPAVSFAGHLTTTLKLDGKSVTILWDTGAIPSIIKQTIAKHFSITPCPLDFPGAKEKNCSLVETHSLTTTKNEALPNTWFKVVPLPSYAPFDGLIGSNFFANHLVYFDMDHHKIFVKRQ